MKIELRDGTYFMTDGIDPLTEGPKILWESDHVAIAFSTSDNMWTLHKIGGPDWVYKWEEEHGFKINSQQARGLGFWAQVYRDGGSSPHISAGDIVTSDVGGVSSRAKVVRVVVTSGRLLSEDECGVLVVTEVEGCWRDCDPNQDLEFSLYKEGVKLNLTAVNAPVFLGDMKISCNETDKCSCKFCLGDNYPGLAKYIETI